MKRSGNKGITLIALVVTIIILIILAGISISMLTGTNGILKRASEAKEKIEQAEKEEKTILSNYEDYINEYTTGVTVEQVTDINPGILEGSGTEDDPYVINSIEDLVFFAYDVTNGNNYEGRTVTLGLSLDFNSSKSYVDPFRTDYEKYGYDGELKTLLTTGEGFQTIGITTEDNKEKNLLGTFDGNNNAIINLYINVNNRDTGVSSEKIGLFANNYGTICNLKLLNVDLYLNTNNAAIAGISGQNSKTGMISNCLVTGEIKCNSYRGSASGITCYCSGVMERCANMANVYSAQIESNVEVSMGGVCSSLGGKILDSYNWGTIQGNVQNSNLLIGGITGNTSGEINNCYNMGNIIGNSLNLLRIGGIVGNMNNSSIVSNCYSVGEVQGICDLTLTMGMIVGRNNGGTISNIYYKKIDETTGVGVANIEANLGIDSDMAKTEDEMKSESFIDLLNVDNSGAWKQDVNNVNNGYPILSWQ